MEVPSLEPAKVAQEILALLDKDKNGTVSLVEAGANPGMKAGFARFDADGDKSMSQAEIEERMKRLMESGTGMMSVTVQVTYGGKALEGGTVRLIPESFLGPAISPAEGTLDADGVSNPISATAGDLGGMQFGMYRVEITHPTLKIPEKYNSATTLGCDISPIDRGGDSVHIELR